MENYLFLCDGMVPSPAPILGNGSLYHIYPFPFIPNGIIPLCSPLRHNSLSSLVNHTHLFLWTLHNISIYPRIYTGIAKYSLGSNNS